MTDLDRNKETVRAFYQAAINEKDFAAARALMGKEYVQHNPRIVDGIEGFEAFVAQIATEFPELRVEVKALYAEGDRVVGHVHGVRVPGQRGTAIVDIFRLEDGLIVEHWDVMQEVPVGAANGNGMF